MVVSLVGRAWVFLPEKSLHCLMKAMRRPSNGCHDYVGVRSGWVLRSFEYGYKSGVAVCSAESASYI